MIASFSSFNQQSVSAPWEQSQQALRTLRQIDNSPGDKNANEGVISMNTSLGHLDAVTFSNPDQSQTVVQRLTKNSGEVRTSWLEMPKQTNGVPNMSGFEVSSFNARLQGINLVVKESYSGNFLIPNRNYQTTEMSGVEAQNALMRADAVLGAWIIA